MYPAAMAVVLLLAVVVFVCFLPAAAVAIPGPPHRLVVYEAPHTVAATSPLPVAIVARYASDPRTARRSPFGRRHHPGMHWIWADAPARYDAARRLVRGPESIALVKAIENDSDEEIAAILAAQCRGGAVDVAFNGVPLAAVGGGDPHGSAVRALITIRRGRNEIRASAHHLELGWGPGGFACAVWGRGSAGIPIVVTDGTWGWRGV